MTKHYWRPIVMSGGPQSKDAVPLAGGPFWFAEADRLERGADAVRCKPSQIPADVLARLCEGRAPRGGMRFDRPQIMGILNATPDSFSDGGDFDAPEKALVHARQMAADGADVIDIGGESTRPGAEVVSVEEEKKRVLPLIHALAKDGEAAISIDTRNAQTAAAALAAGAVLFNDVSALSHDPKSAAVAAKSGAAVCLMHAQGDPKTMQDEPRYDDVLLDVYDYLEARCEAAEAAGIARDRLIADPGIGFGKTNTHNLALIRGLSIFHGLGVPILFGASRKRFIGTIGDAPDPKRRLPGSLAVALLAARAGAHILRVHDVPETVQALALAEAVEHGDRRQKE